MDSLVHCSRPRCVIDTHCSFLSLKQIPHRPWTDRCTSSPQRRRYVSSNKGNARNGGVVGAGVRTATGKGNKRRWQSLAVVTTGINGKCISVAHGYWHRLAGIEAFLFPVASPFLSSLLLSSLCLLFCLYFYTLFLSFFGLPRVSRLGIMDKWTTRTSVLFLPGPWAMITTTTNGQEDATGCL